MADIRLTINYYMIYSDIMRWTKAYLCSFAIIFILQDIG
jgi:hypothetical protein